MDERVSWTVVRLAGVFRPHTFQQMTLRFEPFMIVWHRNFSVLCVVTARNLTDNHRGKRRWPVVVLVLVLVLVAAENPERGGRLVQSYLGW